MKISSNIILNSFNLNIKKGTTLNFQKNPYIAFKGETTPTQDTFLKGSNDVPQNITLEQIHKTGEKFVNRVKKDNSTKNIEKSYKNYHKILTKYFEQNNFRCLKHEWANAVNVRMGFKLYDAKEKNKKIELKEIEKTVEKTNELIAIHQLFSQNGVASGDIVKRFEIQTVFNTALKVAKENAQEKNISISVQNETLLNEIEEGSHQFENYTIFSNILGNAIKYSPEGSDIKVKFAKQKTEYIRRNGEHSGEFFTHYYFIVEDKGIGIPKKDQESILQGTRGSNVLDIYGTGQGLREVAGASGEEIKITSPLYPNEPKYKGTMIKVQLQGWKKPND